MVDPRVTDTQIWLNETYGEVVGWVPLVEDGVTGWNTIYGLRRGLQHELGISPVSSGFGSATTAAFIAQVGQIDASTTSLNLLRLLSGSLWCKGKWGTAFDDPGTTYADLSIYVVGVRDELGLSGGSYVDVKLMASLMSMDAYTLLRRGETAVRDVQQWLNGTYSSRLNFALVPTDGVFSRQTQTAMFYALQYEFGMSDSVANGNFGPGTRQGLRNDAPVELGNVDSTHHFVRLFQGALRLNGYGAVPFTGTFDSTTLSETEDFQSFMELTVNGDGDYGTWCALLVSSGDTERSTVGFDASQQFTPGQALAAASAGYTHIGRYTVGASKFITSAELAGLKAAGLLLFPIQQRFNNSNAEMTQSAGRTQGIEALERCRALGLPDGSTVFFAVDYDPVDTSIAGPVTNFFVGVKGVMEEQLLGNYQVGIYGTRNVCDAIIDSGLASRAFVAGMSTGWSGNMGFRMPEDWSYNQILETSEVFDGATIGIDRVAVSSNAVAVDLSSVVPPPIERDWSESATGFDVLFQWIVSAEATVERALSEASSFMSPVTAYAGFTPFFVLGWLRKPAYWSTGSSAALWKVYTPEPIFPDILVQSRDVSELALDGMSDIRTMVHPDIRDVPHMAVTALGYLEWGIASDPDEYGLGDLGGWTLDLLQLWGQYAASFSSEDLGMWMASMIGKIGGVGPSDPGYLTDPASAFGYADVLADADARLLADAVLGDSSGRALSTAMRSQFQEDGNDRIERFYADNFAADPGNVSAAFTALVDGLDIGPIPNLPFSTELLKLAAGADYGWTGANMPMPTPAQADTIARAYAAFLASPQR